MLTSSALQAATDDLFVVFGAYPFRPHLPAHCDCCPHLDLSGLQSRPLRAQSADDLLDAFHLIPSHAGDSRDLRHFLPRFLELLASGANPSLAPSVLAEHLLQAQLSSWPRPELLALRQFLHLAPETCPAAQLCDRVLPLLASSLRTHGGA